MSEIFPSGPTVKTPLIVPGELSKNHGRSGKLPPIPYDENDSVMRDIQERMRAKRRRNADLSRSRRGNITNASVLLKLSLRANNRALAKALEEARCEANQDKEAMGQLQWSLEYAQQEVRQYKQRVQELEGDAHILMDMLMQRRLSEENLQKTVTKVKSILREVTADHLISVASKLNEAASLCNRAPSLSKGSSIFVRNASDSSDKGDSRDTFSVPVIDPDEPQRTNIYNKKNVAERQMDITEESPETQPGIMDLPDNNVAKDFTPNRFCSEVGKRPSTGRRKSRMSSLLDPVELRQAVSDQPEEPSLITEESEDILVGLDLESTDHLEQEMELTDPKDVPPPSEMDSYGVPAGRQENAEKDRGNDEGENICRDRDRPAVVEESKTKAKGERKKERTVKKHSKGTKGLKKVSKKLTLKKAAHKNKGEASLNSSVFDLSKGESFSKPLSPDISKHGPRLQQNLSTESERSEPGEGANSKDGEDALEQDGSDEVAEEVGVESERRGMDPDDRPLDVHLPKMRRKSRQYQNKIFKKLTTALSCDVVLDAVQAGTAASSLSRDRDARSCRGLGQVLNESSFVAEVEMEEGSVLAKKQAFHRKMAGVKRKKKLYDPNTSLDKELTHSSLTSPGKEEVAKQGERSPPEDGEVCKGAGNDRLVNGALDKPQVEDFLNQIDSEKGGESPSAITGKKSQGRKKKQTRGTFGVSDEGSSTGHGAPEQEVDGSGNDNKTARRGTVCLEKGQTSEEAGTAVCSETRGNTEDAKTAGSGHRHGGGERESEEDLEQIGDVSSPTDGRDARASKMQKDSHVVRRGTVCLDKGSALGGTNTAMNGYEHGGVERQSDHEDIPNRDNVLRKNNVLKEKKTVRRGTVCLSRKETPEEATALVNGLEHSADGSGFEADVGLDGIGGNVESTLDVATEKQPKEEQLIRRGTVCLSKGQIPKEGITGSKDGLASKEGQFKSKREKSQAKRRGTFAVKPKETRLKEEESDREEAEKGSVDGGMDELPRKTAVEKKAKKRQAKRKSDELEENMDHTGESSKKARRVEERLHNGVVDLNHELDDREAVKVEEKTTDVRKRKPLSRIMSKTKKAASRFGWEAKELGGSASKTGDGIAKEIVADGEAVLENTKPVGERSSRRSSSSLGRHRKKGKQTGSRERGIEHAEDAIGEEMEEHLNERADVEESEEDQLPTIRRSKRVSERVPVERVLLKKTVMSEEDDGRSPLDDLGEKDIDEVSKRREDAVSKQPSPPGMDTSGEPRESLEEAEPKNVPKKVAKGRKGVKKGARKSKKRVVQALDDSEDELDGGDLSACSAKLIQEVSQSLEGAEGLGEEEQPLKNHAVHFADENQDANDDIDRRSEKTEREQRPVMKVKKETSKVKSKKKKTSTDPQKGKEADQVQPSGRAAPRDEVMDPPESESQKCVGKENIPQVDEARDASILEPKGEVPEEEMQGRPSRRARAKAVMNLKEPSLGKKLRRGDPFTDAELYISPTLTKKAKKGKASRKKTTAKTALGDSTNVT